MRQLPLSDPDIETLTLHSNALERRRQQLDAGIEALEYLCDNAEALSWEEAPGRLEDSQELVPALQEQLSEAETLLQDSENKVRHGGRIQCRHLFLSTFIEFSHIYFPP